MSRHKIHGAVYLILRKNDQILLLKRNNTGYMDGYYSFPGGHIEEGESAIEAVIREGKEEINVDVKKEDLNLILTMHRKTSEREYLDLFFEAKKYTNEINNNEPEKCSELVFKSINDLPLNIVPYIQQSIECFKDGKIYEESGWGD